MTSPAIQLKQLLLHEYYQSGNALPKGFVEMLTLLCDEIERQRLELIRLRESSDNFLTQNDMNTISERIEEVKAHVDVKFDSFGADIRVQSEKRNEENATKIAEIDRQLSDINEQLKDSVQNQMDPVKKMLGGTEFALQELKEKVTVLTSSDEMNREAINKLKSTMPLNQEGRVTQLAKRLEKLDENVRKIETNALTKNEEIRQGMTQLRNADDEVRAEIRRGLIEVETKLRSMPTTYADEDNQPKIVNGELDIRPLIRGIYRDSKRLDGFNELIATTRLECEDLVNAMIDLQSNMQQFNHNTHDLAMEDSRIKANLGDGLNFLQASVLDLDRHIGDAWSFMMHVAETCSHTASNVAAGFNQIQLILGSMSSRPLPMISDLGDVCLEANSLRDDVFEKRTQYDGDREKYRTLPHRDDGKVRMVKEIAIKRMKRRVLEEHRDIALPYNDIQAKVMSARGDGGDPLLQRSVEEIRVRLNEISENVDSLQEQFKELDKDTTKLLSEKVSEESMTRMFDKVHRSINALVKRLDNMDEDKALTARAEEERRKQKPRDPNAVTVKRAMPTLPREQSWAAHAARSRTCFDSNATSPAEAGMYGRPKTATRSNKTISEMQKLFGYRT